MSTVERIETRHCHAGWRNYHFLKISCNDGVVGWAEYDEHLGATGITHVIEQLAPLVVGQRAEHTERVYARLLARARQSMSGVLAMAIGAIENALLDARARALGVRCVDLLGGPVRDSVPVYWSHCGTWRIARPDVYGHAVTCLDDVAALGAEVRERGFRALKTNMFDFSPTTDGGRPRGWSPGFGTPFQPALNVDRHLLRELRRYLEAFREGAGPDLDILLDLNFNAKPEGYMRIVRALADFELFWVEIDTPHPEALADVRRASPHPVSSCETLLTAEAFLPYLRLDAVDVVIIDAIWNGMWQSMKIAAVAAAHQRNVAPHNYYGHLATLMNAHLAAAIPNLRIMETDIDRVPWDDELFTRTPDIRNGELYLPDAPGWGCEPDEAALARHPPR